MSLRRGGHELPHQSQVTHRDLHGELIREHFGAKVYCYRLTPEQVEDRRYNGPFLPYEFLIHSPRSASLAWTAFYNESDFRAFLEAYAIELSEMPEPGKSFTITLPQDDSRWLPLAGVYQRA